MSTSHSRSRSPPNHSRCSSAHSRAPSPVPAPPSRSPKLVPAPPSHSPSPACYPSPQLAFLHSPGYVSTDSEDDRRRGYVTPVIRGHQLCIINIDGQLRFPICPRLSNWRWTMDSAKDHVLGIVNSMAQNAKKRSHHRCLARN